MKFMNLLTDESTKIKKKKEKAMPVRGKGAHRAVRRRGSQIFKIIDPQMAVRLSALCVGRLLHPRNFLVLISVTALVEPRASVRLEELGKLKKTQ
jgi:hypothetical protein